MVVNNRRSEIEIISEILTLARNGTKKTRILYQTNLSYTQLQNYLIFLLDSEVLVKENNNAVTTYRTTEKGLQIKDNIDKIISQLKTN